MTVEREAVSNAYDGVKTAVFGRRNGRRREEPNGNETMIGSESNTSPTLFTDAIALDTDVKSVVTIITDIITCVT